MSDLRTILNIDETGTLRGVLPQGLNLVNTRPLSLQVEANMSVSIELQMITPLQIEFVLEPYASLEFVEKRLLNVGGKLSHHIEAKEGAKCKGFVLSNGRCKDLLELEETGNLDAYSDVEIAYGELSDGKVQAKLCYELNGPEAKAHLHLAAVTTMHDVKSYEVTINHHAPFTTGLMENYGVTRHSSSLTFDGVGRIDKGMHQSNAHQTSRIMVFESSCKAKANPYLYIDDFDVKASHAASVGAMNDEHLYYLQSRGLTKQAAMHLITLGYLIPAVRVIEDEALSSDFEGILERKVGG